MSARRACVWERIRSCDSLSLYRAYVQMIARFRQMTDERAGTTFLLEFDVIVSSGNVKNALCEKGHKFIGRTGIRRIGWNILSNMLDDRIRQLGLFQWA